MLWVQGREPSIYSSVVFPATSVDAATLWKSHTTILQQDPLVPLHSGEYLIRFASGLWMAQVQKNPKRFGKIRYGHSIFPVPFPLIIALTPCFLVAPIPAPFLPPHLVTPLPTHSSPLPTHSSIPDGLLASATGNWRCYCFVIEAQKTAFSNALCKSSSVNLCQEDKVEDGMGPLWTNGGMGMGFPHSSI